MLATALETALGVTRFTSYYTEFCMAEDDVRACCDFTERLLAPLDGMEPIRSVYVYVPNRKYREECYPADSVSKKKPLSDALRRTDDFMTHCTEVLCRAGIDFHFISDAVLEHGTLPQDGMNRILIVPPCADAPKTDAFDRILKPNTLDEVPALLRDLDCMAVEPQSDGALVTLHKRSQTEEAFLLVNTADTPYHGGIRFRTGSAWNAVSVYNPHDDTTAALDSITSAVTIPAGECRIVKFA